MNIIEQLEKEQVAAVAAKRAVPEFGPGDTVIVNVRVKEGERTRVQAYEGVVIGRSGGGLNENFTVRKISYGEGVERVFPVYSPLIDSIKVVRRGKVRRAKLYYLRGRTGKSARIAEKQKALLTGMGAGARLRKPRRLKRRFSRSCFKGWPVAPALFVSGETIMQEYFDANRRSWDERVAIHAEDETGFYAVAKVLRGEDKLNAIEAREIGDIAGLRIAHLQCHFGLDSFCLERRGADVMGLDFSPAADRQGARMGRDDGPQDAFRRRQCL